MNNFTIIPRKKYFQITFVMVQNIIFNKDNMNILGIIILILGVAIAGVVGLALTRGSRITPRGAAARGRVSLKYLLIGGAIISLILISVGVFLMVHRANLDAEGEKYKAYLSSVYPAMNKNLPGHEYTELYHSLGWYYQCCSKNNTELRLTKEGVGDITGNKVVGPNRQTPNKLRYPTIAKYGSPIPVTYDQMRCCEDQDYQLPAVPLGNLYDWYSMQYFNVPVITVRENGYNFAGEDVIDGNLRDISTFVSQSPLTSFMGIITSVQKKSAVVTPQDPTATSDNLPVGLWAGPGPFYAGERSIIRAGFYPFGPQFLPGENRWTLNGERDYTKWLNLYITRKDAETKLVKDRNTGRHWCNGFEEGDYAEIGHVQQTPGLPSSTGYWYNYFSGGGTGVFHKYGKTPKVSKEEVAAMVASFPKSVTNAVDIVDIVGVSPRNKTHTLFNLLWETRATTKLPQPSGASFTKYGKRDFKNGTYTNGSELLKALYGTDDPWIITMWYCNGYIDPNVTSGTNWTTYNKDFITQGKEGPPNFNGFSFPSRWAKPSWLDPHGLMVGVGPNAKIISRQASTAFLLSVPQLGAYTLPAQAPGNVSLGNMYGVMGILRSGVTFATLAAFLLQAEFGPDHQKELAVYVDKPTSNPLNTLPNLTGPQFPADGGTGGVGSLTYAGVKYALTKVFMGNYFYDRVANGVSFDEPMNYFATVLGYKDLQMPFNTNTNGFWSFESIYVGLPSKEDNLNCDPWAYTWKDTLVKTRKYAFITGAGSIPPPAPINMEYTSYQGPAMAILNQLWGTTLSNRDPFDVYSDKKSLPCLGMGGHPCKNAEMSCTKGALLNINKQTNNITKYQNPLWEGTCTVKENIGMNQESTAKVLWDSNDYCHAPWSQSEYGSNGTLWPELCCMGHSFCQAVGEKPTLSAIWSNVPYGGLEYGTGLVPLYGVTENKSTARASLKETNLPEDGTPPLKLLPLNIQNPIQLGAEQQIQRSLAQLHEKNERNRMNDNNKE